MRFRISINVKYIYRLFKTKHIGSYFIFQRYFMYGKDGLSINDYGPIIKDHFNGWPEKWSKGI